MKNKLGLKPVQAQPRLMLRDFATADQPTVDSLTFPFGHADKIEPQMYLNDELGDCAEVATIETFRLLNATRGVTVNFTDAEAEKAYTEIAGYKPGDASTDGGTDVHELFEFLKATGIADADGQRHKVVGYVGLTPGDWDEMLAALSRFMVVIIGVQITDYAEQQFEDGQPWALLPGRHAIEGGHCIPIVGATDANTGQLFTWAKLAGITAQYYRTLNTVAVVAITEDMFTDGKTLDGYDRDALAAALNVFNTGPVLAKAPKPRAAKRGDGPQNRPETFEPTGSGELHDTDPDELASV